MEGEMIDLTPLAPDHGREEAMVASILDAATPELARRAHVPGPLISVVLWARPMLRIAAVLAVAATATLTLLDRGAQNGSETAGVTEALDVPAPVTEWIDGERGPTTADLLLAMESSR